MTKAKLSILGVSCYLLFTLLLTPAAWWLKLVKLPPQLQLGAVSGTLWQGQVSQLQYDKLQFGALSWKLNGWALLTGQARFFVQTGSMQQSAQPYIKGNVGYGVTGAAMQQLMLRLPVSQVLPLLPLPFPVDATGNLVLDIASYRQGQPWCSTLAGSASWQDANLKTPAGNWIALQSLFGDLSCASGTAVLTTDGANLLGLDIKAVLNAEQLLVNGTIKPDPSMPQEVHQAMQFVSKPDAQGRYTISF